MRTAGMAMNVHMSRRSTPLSNVAIQRWLLMAPASPNARQQQNGHQRLPKEEPHNVAWTSSEAHPQTEFVHSLGHGERKDSVHAAHCKAKRQQRERAEEQRAEPGTRHGRILQFA
jgi:hypothetical protein